MRRVSMATRDELLAAVSERYRASNRADKKTIIDEFAASTGYHRKHAMRVLRTGPSAKRSAPRPSRRIYGAAEREALIVLWEASDRVCGKRLKAVIPTLIEAMERIRSMNDICRRSIEREMLAPEFCAGARRDGSETAAWDDGGSAAAGRRPDDQCVSRPSRLPNGHQWTLDADRGDAASSIRSAATCSASRTSGATRSRFSIGSGAASVCG